MIPLLLSLLIPPGKALPIEPTPAPVLVGQTVTVNTGWWWEGEHQTYGGIGKVVSVEVGNIEVETNEGFWFVTPGECKRVVP